MSREMKWVKKTVEVTVCEEGELTCDNCHKKIDVLNTDGTFYNVVSGHHDWGNDSPDSVREHDACCDECLIEIVKWWQNYWNDCPSAYIEIHRKRISDLRRGKE